MRSSPRLPLTLTSSTRGSAGDRIPLVQCNVEIENVDGGFTQESEEATVLGGADQVANLLFADVAHPGHAGYLNARVFGADVGVEAAAARGHRVGGHDGVCRRGTADRHDLAGRIVLAVGRTFDAQALVRVEERSTSGRTRFVHADHAARTRDVAVRV